MRVKFPAWRGNKPDVWSVIPSSERMALRQSKWPFVRANGLSAKRMALRQSEWSFSKADGPPSERIALLQSESPFGKANGSSEKRTALRQSEWPFGKANGPSVKRMALRQSEWPFRQSEWSFEFGKANGPSPGRLSEWSYGKANGPSSEHRVPLETSLSFFKIRVSRFEFSFFRLGLPLLFLPLWGRKVRRTPFEPLLRILVASSNDEVKRERQKDSD